MTEHLSEQTIERYQRRDLTPMELLAADDHLATCDGCSRLFSKGGEYSQTIVNALAASVLSKAKIEDDHLTYEQLADLVDNEIDEVGAEIARVHLEVCESCAHELRNLQELKMQPSPSTNDADVRTVFQNVGALFSFPGPNATWSWPRLAGAALVLVLAAGLVWILWSGSKRQSQLVATTQPNSNESVVTPKQPSPNPSAAPSAPAVVALNDAGGQVTLDEAGNLSGLNSLTPAQSAAVRKALTTQRLNTAPAIEGLRSKIGTLMGSSGDGVPFALMDPVGLVVLNDRPTFQWRPLPGASAYMVKIYDVNFTEVGASESQPQTSWRITTALRRGAVYTWQVTAIKDGQEIKSPVAPAAEARFRMVAGDKAAEIERLRQTQRSSHLLLGTIYAEAGLLREAEREFRQLAQANPGSQVAQNLLQEILASKTSLGSKK